jgi:hypothetical protein
MFIFSEQNAKSLILSGIYRSDFIANSACFVIFTTPRSLQLIVLMLTPVASASSL